MAATVNTHARRGHRAEGFNALLGTRACSARDNLLAVVNPVVAAGIGNPQAANMETS